MNYYNENEPSAAAYLRELIAAKLIPAGTVDERSIADVAGSDLDGYTQVHFFAGIGGWSEALRLAGWPSTRALWTGSCPCQPYSAAGKGEGDADARNLWPHMFQLIKECRPACVFGEQVASSEVVGTESEAAFTLAVQSGDFARANKLAKRVIASSSFHYYRRWLDGIRLDLEAENYAFRCSVLGAHSVGAPHIRQRLYWMADAESERRATGTGNGGELGVSGGGGRRDVGFDGGLGDADSTGRERRGLSDGERRSQRALGATNGDADGLEHAASDGRFERRAESSGRGVECGRGSRGMGDAELDNVGRDAGSTFSAEGESDSERVEHGAIGNESRLSGATSDFWSCFDLIHCTDGKTRRVESGIRPLAHGVSGRVGLLRGYGNAIVPHVAAAFVKAYLDS